MLTKYKPLLLVPFRLARMFFTPVQCCCQIFWQKWSTWLEANAFFGSCCASQIIQETERLLIGYICHRHLLGSSRRWHLFNIRTWGYAKMALGLKSAFLNRLKNFFNEDGWTNADFTCLTVHIDFPTYKAVGWLSPHFKMFWEVSKHIRYRLLVVAADISLSSTQITIIW